LSASAEISFSLPQNVQTSCGINGYRGTIPGVNWPGWDVNHAPPIKSRADSPVKVWKLSRVSGTDSTAAKGLQGIFDIDIDIFVNCNWVDTRWQ